MRLVIFSDAWGYKYGGINAFNYEFCQAVRTYLINRYRNMEQTANKLVELIVASDISDPERKKFEYGNFIKCICLRKDELNIEDAISLLDESLSKNKECGNTYFIGHDIITGDLAIKCAKHYNGKSVVFRHMAYDEYYSQLTESEEKIEAKINQQKSILTQADIILGVGEKLTESSKQIVLNNKGHAIVRQIVPGFDKRELQSEYPSDQFRIYFAGRIEYEDEQNNNNKIKQYDIVIKAFAELLKEGKIPAASKLYLCGVSSGQAKKHIKNIANKIYAGTVDIEIISYAAHDRLMQILRDSSVAVMPSFSEGFGLVAVEAITSNIPVIISENSGIYRLIKQERLHNCLKSFEVRGDDKKDVPALKNCLLEIFNRQDDARTWASELNSKLSEKYNWQLIVGKFLKLLNVSSYYKNSTKDFEKGLIEIFFPDKKGGVKNGSRK